MSNNQISPYRLRQIAITVSFIANECIEVLAHFLRSNPKARHALKGMAGGLAAGVLVGSLFGPVGMFVAGAGGALLGAITGEEVGTRLENAARAIVKASDSQKQQIFSSTSDALGGGHTSASDYGYDLNNASNREVEDVLRSLPQLS